MADTYADIRRVAHALDADEAGEALVSDMQRRMAAVGADAGRGRPRVAFVEWVEPLMAGGNWMPELIGAAGRAQPVRRSRQAFRLDAMEELAAADPDVIIVAPCGYGLERCLEELPLLQAKRGWAHLQAVRMGRVYFADGNSYFNRPGPRLADSAEMLAEMLWGGIAGQHHEGTAWVRKPS